MKIILFVGNSLWKRHNSRLMGKARAEGWTKNEQKQIKKPIKSENRASVTTKKKDFLLQITQKKFAHCKG